MKTSHSTIDGTDIELSSLYATLSSPHAGMFKNYTALQNADYD